MSAKKYFNLAEEALKKGQALLDEIDSDADLTPTAIAEKTVQADSFFAEVDVNLEKAERFKKAADQALVLGALSEAAEQLPLGAGVGDGKTDQGLTPEIKAIALENRYPVRKGFTPGDMTKAMAAAAYWQHGKGWEREYPDLAKALATAPGAAGGYLVGDTYSGLFVEFLGDVVAMRDISNVLPPIPGGSHITPTQDTDMTDATWTSEILTGSEDTVLPFGGRVITPHPLAKRIKVSKTLLRASNLFGVENWILQGMARKFAEPEEAGFISGTGTNQPLGLLIASGISSTSTAASTTLAGDDVIDWIYALGTMYANQPSARILCNKTFIREIRKLKTGAGNYLWLPGLAENVPNTILDVPYTLSDKYPTGRSGGAWVGNALVATYGAFDMYWIVDSLSFEIQRVEELYAETNQTGFIGRKETDGMPVDDLAFEHLKITA